MPPREVVCGGEMMPKTSKLYIDKICPLVYHISSGEDIPAGKTDACQIGMGLW